MSVLGLFLVFSHLTLFVIYRCFGKCCWLVLVFNTFSGNGQMAEMDTYVLFMVHADTDDTNDT